MFWINLTHNPPTTHLRTPVAGEGNARERGMPLIRRNTYLWFCEKTLEVETMDEGSLEKFPWCWLVGAVTC